MVVQWCQHDGCSGRQTSRASPRARNGLDRFVCFVHARGRDDEWSPIGSKASKHGNGNTGAVGWRSLMDDRYLRHVLRIPGVGWSAPVKRGVEAILIPLWYQRERNTVQPSATRRKETLLGVAQGCRFRISTEAWWITRNEQVSGSSPLVGSPQSAYLSQILWKANPPWRYAERILIPLRAAWSLALNLRGSPQFWTSSFIQKQMSADCGSARRGFESRYSPPTISTCSRNQHLFYIPRRTKRGRLKRSRLRSASGVSVHVQRCAISPVNDGHPCNCGRSKCAT